MKFVCMGYLDVGHWSLLSEEERQSRIQDCLAYDQVLRAGQNMLGGDCLCEAGQGRTLRKHNGQVVVTDGPYAETKEMMGGLLYLEARDLDHAVELMSRHPGLEMGPFEVRPTQAVPGAPPPEEEIRLQIAAWSRALEAKDVEAMMADYAEDAVLYDAIPAYKVVGREAIAQAWRQCLPHFPETFRSEHRDLEIRVSGDLATVFGLHHFAVDPPGHPCAQTWMRITVVFERRAGHWKVVHEHISIPFNPLDDRAWKITDPDRLEAPDYTACQPCATN